ncbi:transcriptional regulator, PadR-like family [Solidesulfovibrio fructosivorans JJ]]|uniref:Transcriptional regulator, PadR-like family n=1 Tax=Solidesulfovibrio fructosivorans JJ] TaxID=596151 RepID=E1JSP7_SOLFR|nr:helix-turn-helix transcriptional regulator [Solidesulfovibrio fructosivorans]EFL52530.1 transcriptional regulator, PadR-like family [Solidesulfovibrio fructosivorans JJ]]
MATEKTKGYRHLHAFLLLALAHGPGHGAALRGRMQGLLPVRGVDSGAVYRTLATLEADGEVVGAWDVSERGPAKKTYQLTERGWERLKFWRGDIAYRARLLAAFLEDADAVLAGERVKGDATCEKQ